MVIHAEIFCLAFYPQIRRQHKTSILILVYSLQTQLKIFCTQQA